MYLFSTLLSALGVPFLGVQGILTQQDPSEIHIEPIDPHNHYNLETKAATPTSPDTGNATFHVFVVAPTNSNGALTCSTGSPCIDGSCCGPQNICGFGSSYCGKGCQSQCNATAPCGRDSTGGDVSCGMNLCCSHYGWCGVSEDYCSTAGTGPCQQGFGGCE
jgi:chitinase